MTIHRFLRTLASAVILTSTLAVATACASAAPRNRVYVRIGPPAPIVERRIVAPGPGYVWIPGFHSWDGRAYLWRPGRWDTAHARTRAGFPRAGSAIDGRAGISSRDTGDKEKFTNCVSPVTVAQCLFEGRTC